MKITKKSNVSIEFYPHKGLMEELESKMMKNSENYSRIKLNFSKITN